MTRQEAIVGVKALLNSNYVGSLSGEDIEALNFAIDSLKLDRNCEKPLIKCNICKYYTKMEGCLNDRCERFKDITHPYCYCYWGKEKGAD